MARSNELNQYLPLTEASYYILLTLVQPTHGYAVMQIVEEISQGTVKIGPGTLYGAFSQMEKEKLIEKVSEEDRRKCYQLTAKGKELLKLQVDRLKIMTQNGEAVVRSL